MNSIGGLDTNFDEFIALKNIVYSGVNIDPVLEILANANSVEERREIISAIANEALRIQSLNLSKSEIEKRFDSIASRIASKYTEERFSQICNFYNSMFAQVVKNLKAEEQQDANTILLDCRKLISEIHNKFSIANGA